MKEMRVHAMNADVTSLVGCVIAAVLVLITSMQAGAHETEQSPGMNDSHRYEFPGAIYQLHQLLAPLWHSQPGRDRVNAACNQASQLHILAQNIASAPVPERVQQDGVGWHEAVREMIVSLGQLSRACSENSGADAEATLLAAQRAFHRMVAYLGHRH